jgi:hypothetical protein
MQTQPQFEGLLKTLPAIIARTRIEHYLGGIISRGYLQNLDSEGRGPEKIRCGRKICYTREALVEWLMNRSTEASIEVRSAGPRKRPPNYVDE